MTPVDVCPRLPGEGYEKCESVCHQVGHAEVVALDTAALHGYDVQDARAYITGHDHVCRSCQLALFGAGVSSITVGSAP